MIRQWAVWVHACGTWKESRDSSDCHRSEAGLVYREFQTSQGYMARSCLKNQPNKTHQTEIASESWGTMFDKNIYLQNKLAEKQPCWLNECKELTTFNPIKMDKRCASLNKTHRDTCQSIPQMAHNSTGMQRCRLKPQCHIPSRGGKIQSHKRW